MRLARHPTGSDTASTRMGEQPAASAALPLGDESFSPVIAAVLYDRGSPIEAFLALVAERLRSEGLRVGGLLQHNLRSEARSHCSFELEDLVSGTRYRATQNLGSGSLSCALDIFGFTDASGALRRAVTGRAHIVIVNKFGSQEALGHGMRAEMLQIVLAGIPLLTSVGRRHLPAWLEFVGNLGRLLPMSLTDVLAWSCQARSATRRTEILCSHHQPTTRRL